MGEDAAMTETKHLIKHADTDKVKATNNTATLVICDHVWDK